MIYVPLKHLRPGMLIARNVYSDILKPALLTTGRMLSLDSIDKLAKYGVPGVYIEGFIADDAVVEDFIEPAVKRKMLREIKTIHSEYMNKDHLSSSFLSSIADMARQLVLNILSNDELLVNVIDIKDYDEYTYSHCMCVGILSVLIGVKMGYSEKSLIELAIAGLLHDIGKIDIPVEIINKGDALTEEEFDIIKKHPEYAVNRIKHCRDISYAALLGIMSHHERYDGSGYPRGVSGNSIPTNGRILALADVYDALTSKRPYRDAWLPNEAIEYMMAQGDAQFDYELLQVFLRTVVAYPVGTVVKLSNGFIAVVIKINSENVLRPVIRVVSPSRYYDCEIDMQNSPEFFNITIQGLGYDDIAVEEFATDRASKPELNIV